MEKGLTHPFFRFSVWFSNCSQGCGLWAATEYTRSWLGRS
jgi:hypothetical protein